MDYLSREGKANCCNEASLPVFLRDPYAMWDRIPCPPPGHSDILLKTNWKKHLSVEDGYKILLNISRRCNLTMPEFQWVPGRLATAMLISSCESKCILTVVLTCVLLTVFGFTLIAYLIHRIERQKKFNVKTNLVTKSSPCNEASTSGTKALIQFYGDRENILKLSSFRGSPNVFPSFTPYNTTPVLSSTYDYRRGTSVSSRSTSIKCPYSDCTFEEEMEAENDVVLDSTASTSLSRHHVYETLDRFGDSSSFDTFDNYRTFNSITELPQESERDINKVDVFPCRSRNDPIYETLTLRNQRKPLENFPATPPFAETPLSSQGVGKWEYIATLNRIKAIN